MSSFTVGDGWKWRVTMYYNAKPGGRKQPFGLAIETAHKDDVSKDMEIDAARSRPDIGDIVVAELDRYGRVARSDTIPPVKRGF